MADNAKLGLSAVRDLPATFIFPYKAIFLAKFGCFSLEKTSS